MKRERKEMIEIAEIYTVILTDNFLNDSNCIEEVIYAKNLKKPFIIIKKKGTKNIIPDLFKNADILIEYETEGALSQEETETVFSKAINILKKRKK